MTPLEARRAATQYEKEHPTASLHEAFIQGYLFRKNSQEAFFVDDTPALPEKPSPPLMSDDELFEYAWQLYDRKDNKKCAIRAWKKLSLADKKRVLDVIPAYVRAHDDKKYRPMFATFLNQERYNDEEFVIENNSNYGRAEQQERTFLEQAVQSFNTDRNSR